ncbi:MAG: D-Ala-D-Ala carboxypeptidase family metallohydrolase [Eubacterium sp.]|nr:D-Ala-D-Ala carboxypeptidase family metallohydrolase [Eubacterium sp.]
MKILYKGIDISKHNGKIDWNKINKNEVQFVIIRAGLGFSTVDEQFKANIEGAIKAGIHIGIFWFSYAGSAVHAKTEAAFCLKTIEPYRKYIDFPVFFDWEYDSHDYVVKQYKITPTKTLVSDAAIAFMETVKAAGYKVGNYTNPDYASQYFDDRVKKGYDTWLAHTGVNGAPKTSTNYTGSYTIWQYSWVGSISGISGKVDTDYCYKDYCGGAAVSSAPTAEKTYQIPKGITFRTDTSKNVITSYSLKKSGNVDMSDHFKVREFASKSGSKTYSDTVKVHNKLIIILEALFAELNCSKIIVNSGYRTAEHDKAVGGNGAGQHVLGRAADIVCYGKDGKIIPAKKVCCTLEDMGGIYGIGYISPNAVHVDTRAKTAKWWGDETKSGSPNISKLGYTSFHKYFNM